MALRTSAGPGRSTATPAGGPVAARAAQRSAARRTDLQSTDSIGLDRRLILMAGGLRWGTVALGLLLGALNDPGDVVFVGAGVALVAHAVLLTFRPAHLAPLDREAQLGVTVELAMTLTAATATGGLESPFVLTPAVPVVLAGYTWGRHQIVGLSIGGAIATVVAVTMSRADPDSQRSAALLGLVLVLCGALGAFARRAVMDIAERHAAALEEMSRLATANDLLVALHGVAQTLPASLDLGEVVDSIRARLRPLFQIHALSILVRDEPGDHWHVALAEGVRLPETITSAELAPPVLGAVRRARPSLVQDLLVTGERGLMPTARSGLYVPLLARGNVAGLLTIEHERPAAYGSADVDLLANLSGPLALAVDNARWFGRLRRFGAEAERARIARDLHDRLAQSLAYVAFELERLSDSSPSQDLQDLRDVVRGVVTELRETLYQLRADVTTEHDLTEIAAPYIARFQERTGIRVDWRADADETVPFKVEQELWRILQEALTNVERHSHALHASVQWQVAHGRVSLQVIDDGRGFVPADVRRDRYGLVGMHERADAIGASLRVESTPGHGTAVTVELGVPR